MRSNSAPLAVLVLFAACCSAAQSGWEPSPDTKILERPRATETQTILLRLGSRNDSNQSTAILDNPFIQQDERSDARPLHSLRVLSVAKTLWNSAV